ncbi:MAG TPA: serine/threonine protein kinase, partial [Arcobacter sp.]|nr:serine/threonine protein kinase [Arcobacter sp.]
MNGIALPKGSYLEEYVIEKELGAGTFGVTYLATDTNLDKQVVIKEYLPNEIAIRQDSVTIMPKSQGDQENFE